MKRVFLFALAGALLVTLFAGGVLAKGKGTKPDKTATYIFEGPITSVDEASRTVTVDVEQANNAAEPFVGQQKGFAVTEATRISLDDAKATLADLNNGQIATIQAKAAKGTTNFTARKVSAETPPAPYYSDADGDGIGAGEPVLYVPGTEPASFVSQGGDNCPDLPNPDQTDTDGDGMGDACDAADTQTSGGGTDSSSG